MLTLACGKFKFYKHQLGPSLPAFVTPNVLDVLVKNYNLTPIGTPEGDLKKILA